MIQASLGINRKMNAFELINFCYGKTLNEGFAIKDNKDHDINKKNDDFLETDRYLK